MTQIYATAVTQYYLNAVAAFEAGGPILNIAGGTLVVGDGGGIVPSLSALLAAGGVTHEVWRGQTVQSVSVDPAVSNQLDIQVAIPVAAGGVEIGPFTVREFAILDATGARCVVGTTNLEKTTSAQGQTSDLVWTAAIVYSGSVPVTVTPPSSAYVTIVQFNGNLPHATAPITTTDTTTAAGFTHRVFGLPLSGQPADPVTEAEDAAALGATRAASDGEFSARAAASASAFRWPYPTLQQVWRTFVPIVPTAIFYVNNATGSDTTGDGLTPTTAWATIAYAIGVLRGYNFGGAAVTLQLGLTGVVYAPPPPFQAPSNGTLVIRGDPGAQASYTIGGQPVGGNWIIGVNGGAVLLSGLTLANNSAVASSANCIAAGATLNLDHVTFAGTCTAGYHVVASSNSLVGVDAGCVFAQSGIAAWYAQDCGVINQFADTTTSGSPVWSTGCAVAINNGVIAFGGAGGWAFVNAGGTSTGPRYAAIRGGVIDINSGGANTSYFPGSVAGSAATGYYN